MDEQTILDPTNPEIDVIAQDETTNEQDSDIQTEPITQQTSLEEIKEPEIKQDEITEQAPLITHEEPPEDVPEKIIETSETIETENITVEEVIEAPAEIIEPVVEQVIPIMAPILEDALNVITKDEIPLAAEVAPAEIIPLEEIPVAPVESVTEVKTDVGTKIILPEKTAEQKAEEMEKARIRAEKQKAREKRAKEQEERKKNFEEVFAKLKTIKENNEIIEVEVQSRIKGGLRVYYEHAQLFLPASHFSLKRNPSENEINDAVGKKVKVYIHELQEDEQGRKTVIVSRKNILEDDFWTQINTGDIVEGTVSSIASFGVFVDIGGIEGLIHISRLSQVHVEDPKQFVKKGQRIQAVVIEVDRTKNRIALSRKELEESPWKNAIEKYPVGSQFKGIVRRLTEFGAYIELTPGVDGLLRTSELSWTKRLKKPADLLKTFEEINVEILSVNEEKQTMTLSYKRTTPNPWYELKEKYPIGMEFNAKVNQIVPQGAIISLTDDIDGFMPRSKMRNLLKGKKIPYQAGDFIDVLISEIIPEEESLILAPKAEEEVPHKDENEIKKPSENRREKNQNQNQNQNNKDADQGSFTIMDILSDKGNFLNQ